MKKVSEDIKEYDIKIREIDEKIEKVLLNIRTYLMKVYLMGIVMKIMWK